MYSPELYQRALRYAAEAHLGQCLPGSDLPYLVHLANVAMEVERAPCSAKPGQYDGDLAIACALLHDTLEDTSVSFNDLSEAFGATVAEGVLALTKDTRIAGKRAQMEDPLMRIRRQPKEISMVKLADRITNLQAPPAYWSFSKRQNYREEARLILNALPETHAGLEARLKVKIEEYARYCQKDFGNGF